MKLKVAVRTVLRGSERKDVMTDNVKDSKSGEVEEMMTGETDMQMDTVQSGSHAVQPQIQAESSTVPTFSEAAMREEDNEEPPEKRSFIEGNQQNAQIKQQAQLTSDDQEMHQASKMKHAAAAKPTGHQSILLSSSSSHISIPWRSII